MDYLYFNKPAYFFHRLFSYANLKIWYYLTAIGIAILVLEILKIKKRIVSFKHAFFLATFIVYLVLVFSVTVFSRTSEIYQSVSYIPFHSVYEYLNREGVSYLMREDVFNAIMFMPFGFLCCGMGKIYELSIRDILKFCMLTSCCIEALQIFFHRGNGDIDDVIFNVIGCLIGVGVHTILKGEKNE